MLDVLRFVTVCLMGIASGVNIMWIVAILPALRLIGPGEALRVKQMLDPRVDRFQPQSVALALAAGIAILFWSLTTTQYVCTAIGIAGALGVAVTSFGFNVPINKVVATWSPDAVPSEFPEKLARWSRFHVVRTVFTVVSAVGYLLAVLVDVS